MDQCVSALAIRDDGASHRFYVEGLALDPGPIGQAVLR